jgi:hypothetical protein
VVGVEGEHVEIYVEERSMAASPYVCGAWKA